MKKQAKQLEKRNLGIAENMIKEGFKVEVIAKLTGLKKEEIENLKKV